MAGVFLLSLCSWPSQLRTCWCQSAWTVTPTARRIWKLSLTWSKFVSSQKSFSTTTCCVSGEWLGLWWEEKALWETCPGTWQSHCLCTVVSSTILEHGVSSVHLNEFLCPRSLSVVLWYCPLTCAVPSFSLLCAKYFKEKSKQCVQLHWNVSSGISGLPLQRAAECTQG